VTRFDWNTHWSAQDYDWADLYQGIRDAARGNREGAVFYNGTPALYSTYSDCGYFEGVGFVKPRDWRALADRLFLVKLYQPDDRWTMPLYWQDDVKEMYAAYCYALALKPGEFVGGTPCSPRWPVVEAAGELREARLVPEANPSPCWWRESTELETYALRLPAAGLLTAISHEETQRNAELSCDLEPLGLDAAKPVHVWLFRPRPVAHLEQTVTITQAEANRVFTETGGAPYRACPAEFLGTTSFPDGRAKVAFALAPGRVGIVLLTQSPSLATSVEGRPRHFILPPPNGASAATVPADRPLAPDVLALRDGYALPERYNTASIVPQHSSPETVNRKVTEVGSEVAGLQVLRLLTADCEHNLEDVAEASIRETPEAVHLAASSGQHKLYGFAYSAVEATGPGTLKLRVRLSEPLYGRYATRPESFVGMVADYATADGYSRRVRLALRRPGTSAISSRRPWFGVFDAHLDPAPLWADLTGAVQTGEGCRLDIDLGRYAPEGWTGQVLFGPYLETCGLGVSLSVDILGNGPAGPRDPRAFAPAPAPIAQGKTEGVFHGANIYRLEDGARLLADRITFPAGGCIEADGMRITKWLVNAGPAATGVELWINYQRTGGQYELVRHSLGDAVAPGGQAQVERDLGQFSPPDWNGRVRIRLQGKDVSADLVDNSPFQLF